MTVIYVVFICLFVGALKCVFRGEKKEGYFFFSSSKISTYMTIFQNNRNEMREISCKFSNISLFIFIILKILK